MPSQKGFPLPSWLNGLFLIRGFLEKESLEIEKLCKKEGRRLKTPQNWEAEPRVKYENNKDIRGKPTDFEKTLICKGCVMRQLRKRLKKD
ncbi:hypothetical protein [Flavobacterium ginsengisoli]|uniref:hypothetical protein n=1 Tax=Flavobacterium ginsengisoli TaxID=871694 RepID=UPI002415532A|nr:hypothetical protein [Flavobacterium ginsengisoli]